MAAAAAAQGGGSRTSPPTSRQCLFQLAFSRPCPVGNAGPFQLVVQSPTERLTRAREARHDGSNGNVHHISDLSIRQILQFAEDEQFTKPIGHVPQGPLDQPDVIGLEQQRLGVGCWLTAAMLLFIERVGGCWETVAPVKTYVANDSEEPRARISAGKRPKVSEGAERRLLDDIFCIVLIPHEPARQPKGGIEMGQDNLVKRNRGCRRGPARFVTHGALRGLA